MRWNYDTNNSNNPIYASDDEYYTFSLRGRRNPKLDSLSYRILASIIIAIDNTENKKARAPMPRYFIREEIMQRAVHQVEKTSRLRYKELAVRSAV
jgi:hypothetical protein